MPLIKGNILKLHGVDDSDVIWKGIYLNGNSFQKSYPGYQYIHSIPNPICILPNLLHI